MTHIDRKGQPIEVGTVCTFYSAVDGEPTLRLRVINLHDGYGLVDGEVLEILAEDRPHIWRNERTVTPPCRLLEIEGAS